MFWLICNSGVFAVSAESQSQLQVDNNPSAIIQSEVIVPSSFISRRTDPIKCSVIAEMTADQERFVLSRREITWSIAGLFGLENVAMAQRGQTLQEIVLTTVRQVLLRVQRDRWITRTAPEVISILDGFTKGTYGITGNTDPRMPVARAEDPPSRNLTVNTPKYAQFSEREKEPIIAHEMFHFGATQRSRTQESIGIMATMPRSFNAVLSSLTNRRNFKRSLALDVQNEVEAIDGEMEYRAQQARSLGFKTIDDYFNDFIQHTTLPEWAAAYRSRMTLLVRGTSGRTQLNIDELRVGLLFLQFLNPDTQSLLLEIAKTEGININDGDAVKRWALIWLKDPTYYKPTRISPAAPRKKAEIRPGETGGLAVAAIGSVGAMSRREFFGEAAGTTATAFVSSPLKWFEHLFNHTSQAVSLRARISRLALVYRADQPSPKRKKSVDYTNIEDDYDAGHFGGLGTGSIGFNLFGQLTSVRLSGNPSNQIFPEGQISVYESNGKDKWVTPLGKHPDLGQAKDKRLLHWAWAEADQMANSAVVRLLHPFTQWEYGRPLGQAGQVTVRRFSPMVPGNVNASNLPLQVTEVEIENTSHEPREFSVMVSMPNFSGWDSKIDDPHYQLLPTNEGQYSTTVTNDKHVGLVMGADQAKDPRFIGRTALFTSREAGLTVTTLPAFDTNGTGADEAWNSFSINGTFQDGPQQTTIDEARTPQNGKELAGAVAVKFTLQPGKKRVIPFSYSFDFPNDIRNERTFNKNYVNTSANRTEAARQMAELAVDKHAEWAADIDHWQAKILGDHRIPDHVKTLLINEIYFLIAGGGLFAKDGTLYLLEGWDPRLLGTSDVWFYTPMLAELFPELEKGLMRAMAAGVLAEDKTLIQYHGPFVTGDGQTTQTVYGGDETVNQKEADRLKGGIEVPGKYPGFLKVAGAAPHHLDDLVLGPVSEKVDNPVGRHINRYLRNHNTWKDLSPKFVLMLWRAYVLDGKKDRAFLQNTWPALQATLDHQRSFVDETGLPVHQGFPDWTYDTWPIKGYGTYTAVLTLEALKAAIAIGKELGKTDEELKEYTDWLKIGRQSIQKYLWNENGGYFYISAEKGPDGKITPKDDVMADALMGALYAKLYRLDDEHARSSDVWLKPVVSDQQIRSHLKKVYSNNFEQFHDGMIGVVNGTTANAKPLATVGGDVQAGEVWIGTQRAVSALMIRVGLKKEANKILDVDLSNTSNGFQGRTPEALSVGKDGDIRFRFSTYMRAGSIWSVFEALKLYSQQDRRVLFGTFLQSSRHEIKTAA